MKLRTVVRWLLGRSLANSEDSEQKIGAGTGVAVLGLDALSSAAYGPEAALTVLLPISALGLNYIGPIIAAIVLLMFVVYFSYRQTIAAYPTGGGSYTVAKENLGRTSGLLAASALLLDYILTVAVGISAGVGALISALPILQPFVLSLCLIILVGLVLTNLRGIKESGFVFTFPTYAFIGSLLVVIVIGTLKVILAHGHPTPVDSMPAVGTATEAVTFWLILRAFASGCTAMTGVEAVSNGVKVFREPVVGSASRTLTIIIFVLAVMLVGIAFLAKSYGILATPPGETGYESMVSQLVRAIAGRGIIYSFTMASVIAVLCFSANTAFADFPRLCQILAHDNYLPHAFAQRGRRLVFSQGIWVLALMAGILLVLFGGITDRLIPLYAIGAFLAFTLSQAGMVSHWLRQPGARQWRSILINAAGATATAVTLGVVLVSKFAEGGWVTVILIPLSLLAFVSVRRHYSNVDRQLACRKPVDFQRQQPLVIVPMKGWNMMSRETVEYAVQISDQIYIVHVENEEEKNTVVKNWEQYIAEPARSAGVPVPKLVNLKSPYRKLFGSMFNFIDELEQEFPGRRIVVVLPFLTERKWYNYFLHNHRSSLFVAALYLRADPKISLVTVPWYLH